MTATRNRARSAGNAGSARTPASGPGDDPSPATPTRRSRKDPRKERTPKRLVAAARIVFERDGFYHARLADITAEANLASGTLYNYYRSKHEIFRDVMREVTDELTALAPDHVSGQQDPVRRLEEVNRIYLRAFRRNARLMSLLYQTRDEDAELQSMWDEIASHFQQRAIVAIRNWQRAGLAYSDLDPLHAAHALTFMVERLAMAWSYDSVDYDEQTLIDTVNKLWERSLGLADGPRKAPRPAKAATAARGKAAVKPPAKRQPSTPAPAEQPPAKRAVRESAARPRARRATPE